MSKDDTELTIFLCGPNRKCEHVFDTDAPLLNCQGEEVGFTTVCSKCGESAFNLSLWDGI